MKVVDDLLFMTAGFYSELFKLIDQYDGDTHMDVPIKEAFTKNVATRITTRVVCFCFFQNMWKPTVLSEALFSMVFWR